MATETDPKKEQRHEKAQKLRIKRRPFMMAEHEDEGCFLVDELKSKPGEGIYLIPQNTIIAFHSRALALAFCIEMNKKAIEKGCTSYFDFQDARNIGK